ncbi:MAG: ATP synthase F0 subunit C [Bacilli bacterium]|nr:ATP synthase F0 subunit C [Bacilli bacterium]
MVNIGIIAIAAAITMIATIAVSAGESYIAAKALEGIARNPDCENKIRPNMIMAIAMVETAAIYCLLIALLIIFVLGNK